MQVYWLQQSERDVPPENSWLTAGEAARLATMRFPKRRADWRLGRWTAKRALASYLGLAASYIEIRSAPSGAPEPLVKGEPALLSMSLSHRDGMALCLIGPPGAALGCDLEIVEPHSAAFATDYFTTEEQALVERAPAAGRIELLALLWSAKESVLKALREGLRLDPRSVSVVPQITGGGDWLPLDARAPTRSFAGWWQRSGSLLRTMVADPPAAPPLNFL